MKTFLALSLAVLTSSSAYSAEIFTATQTQSSVWISRGFSDSSFDYSESKPNLNTKAFCFVGELKDVCGEIESAVALKLADYENGGHDFIDNMSCKADDYGIKLSYDLFDDYDGQISVNRSIYSCGDFDSKANAQIVGATFSENGTDVYTGTFQAGVIDSKSEFCFSGKLASVCEQIRSDLAKNLKEYENGAHAYQELIQCSVDESGRKVKADFLLHSDYDSEPTEVSKTISACLN